jgi:SAM-dependent methyltransferase
LSHPQQRRFVARAAALHPIDGPLLEVGSLDVNGSVRDLFPLAAPYVGIDLAPGRAVDVVASGHDFGRDESFATVVTTECLEHDPGWRDTLANIERVLRPGGVLILTCATTGRHEHGTARTSPAMSPFTSRADGRSGRANDHYKNLVAADVVDALPNLRVDLVATCWSSFDLNLVARKPPAPPPPHALARLQRDYRVDGLRPSRLADRVLLRAWGTDTMGDVPLWAALTVHPVRAGVLGASLLRRPRG